MLLGSDEYPLLETRIKDRTYACLLESYSVTRSRMAASRSVNSGIMPVRVSPSSLPSRTNPESKLSAGIDLIKAQFAQSGSLKESRMADTANTIS